MMISVPSPIVMGLPTAMSPGCCDYLGLAVIRWNGSQRIRRGLRRHRPPTEAPAHFQRVVIRQHPALYGRVEASGDRHWLYSHPLPVEKALQVLGVEPRFVVVPGAFNGAMVRIVGTVTVGQLARQARFLQAEAFEITPCVDVAGPDERAAPAPVTFQQIAQFGDLPLVGIERTLAVHARRDRKSVV